MKKTEINIELNVHELDIILKALELVENVEMRYRLIDHRVVLILYMIGYMIIMLP